MQPPPPPPPVTIPTPPLPLPVPNLVPPQPLNISSPHLQPKAVRMGDFVYLPVFKLNSNGPNKDLVYNSSSPTLIDENNNHNSNNLVSKPLDLSSKPSPSLNDDNSNGSCDDGDDDGVEASGSDQANNMPLDLSIKSEKQQQTSTKPPPER